MKILVLSERFPPEGSGGPLATYLLLSKLVKEERVKVTVLTSTKRPWCIPKVKYIFLSQLTGKNKFEALFNQLSATLNPKIVDIVKEHDLIYITDHSYPFAFVAKKLKKPVIVHLHDFFPISASSTILNNKEIKRNTFSLIHDRLCEALYYEVLQGRTLLRGIGSSCTHPIHALVTISALMFSNIIVTVSRLQLDMIIAHIPFIKNKIRILYNMPPPLPSLGRPSSARPSYLYLGGANIVKGFHLIIKTILILKKRFRKGDYELILAGIGMKNAPTWLKYSLSSPRSINSIVAQLFRIKGVKVLEWMERRALLSYLKSSWSLIHPSICYEPLPYALIEACLAGRIPITNTKTGFIELIPRTLIKDFLLIKNTPEEIAEKITLIGVLSPDEVYDIGCKIRQKMMHKLNPDIIIRKFLNIIYQVTS